MAHSPSSVGRTSEGTARRGASFLAAPFAGGHPMKIKIVAGATPQVLIDGEDWTNRICAEGFKVDLTEPCFPMVHLTLQPQFLDIDIENAEVTFRRGDSP